MSADAALHVRISVERQGVHGKGAFALDVAFDAEPGVTILFGPSGSGKSTVLAAIAGLVRPSSGRVALGDDVWFDSAKRVSRPTHKRGIAFVFQTLALFPHMTAAANVAYGMSGDLARDAKRARIEELLARLKVPHLIDRKPPTYSGGEAQRVALARAFAMSPRIALFDEPFSALDRELRKDLVADVRALVEERKLVLVHVTHQRNEARALGDRVVLLDGGRVARTGTMSEIFPRERDMTFDETPMPRKDGKLIEEP